MNIFYLDSDPKLAAQYHCDKHVVKMIPESAQLLSTAHRVLDGVIGIRLSKIGYKLKTWILPDDREDFLYKASHVNHPCAVWVRENSANYSWTFSLFQELSREYTHRYGKQHASYLLLADFLDILPDNIKIGELSMPALAMPDEYKHENPVVAYRRYYLEAKKDLLTWTKRSIPYWSVHEQNLQGSSTED